MDQHTYSVSELTGEISATLGRRFPDEVWVQGEIRDLSRSRNGHVYFSLVDEGTDGKETLLPVTLFASERFVVNRVLMRSGGAVRMTDGINVRIRGRISLYAQRSTVQLRMTWIDTDFTLGQLAAERTALIKTLTDDGSLARNGALPLPLVPLTVGVVTSEGSAAHADFVTELERSGFGFQVVVAHATVQGIDAPESIAAALDRFASRSLDVVAVVRGGGAQTDLATFDTEIVARAIARCDVPVFTGIGHETDQTVADLAAHRALKTPTATAQAIVAAVGDFAARLDRAATGVRRAHRATIDRSAVRMDHLGFRLRTAADRHIERKSLQLDAHRASLAQSGERTAQVAERRVTELGVRTARLAGHRLSTASLHVEQQASAAASSVERALHDAEQRIEVLATVVQARDPAEMFSRGWSITYAADGSVVRNPDEVGARERLRTVVQGGTLTSVVVENGDEA